MKYAEEVVRISRVEEDGGNDNGWKGSPRI